MVMVFVLFGTGSVFNHFLVFLISGLCLVFLGFLGAWYLRQERFWIYRSFSCFRGNQGGVSTSNFRGAGVLSKHTPVSNFPAFFL